MEYQLAPSQSLNFWKLILPRLFKKVVYSSISDISPKNNNPSGSQKLNLQMFDPKSPGIFCHMPKQQFFWNRSLKKKKSGLRHGSANQSILIYWISVTSNNYGKNFFLTPLIKHISTNYRTGNGRYILCIVTLYH